MQISSLFDRYDELQSIYGGVNLRAVYGAGLIDRPRVCLVFMNPTAKNISSDPAWTWMRAPWIATKHVWRMLAELELFDVALAEKIASMRAEDWTPEFAEEVYADVASRGIYITNLAKATQVDARPLLDSVFHAYREAFLEELALLNPERIVTFGNQVSSVLLWKNIRVSEYRKRSEVLSIGAREYSIFPVYYPVGQGMRNMGLAKEDIEWTLSH